jgi:tetratricopeptide (TPR) repeat protein
VVHYPLGCTFLNEDNQHEAHAIQQWEKALEYEPSNVDLHTCLGLAYYQKGHLQKAIEELRRAAQLSPLQAAAHNNLALAYAKSGNLKQAVMHFERALQLDPGDPATHSNLGLAYYFAGLTDRALEEWRQAGQLDPNLAERGNHGQKFFDDTTMSSVTLDWQERALHRPPLTAGWQYRFQPSLVEEGWEIDTSDPELAKIPPLQRAIQRVEEALHEVRV